MFVISSTSALEAELHVSAMYMKWYQRDRPYDTQKISLSEQPLAAGHTFNFYHTTEYKCIRLKSQNFGNISSCKNESADFRLAEQIYNRISLLWGFDSGTQPTLLGKPKFIAFPFVICSQASPWINRERWYLNWPLSIMAVDSRVCFINLYLITIFHIISDFYNGFPQKAKNI